MCVCVGVYVPTVCPELTEAVLSYRIYLFAGATITNSMGWAAQATEVYFLWRLEVRDQGVSRFNFF